MRIPSLQPRVAGFTLVELLTVMTIIGILTSLLLPVLSRGQSRARLVWCGNNLSQCGLAFQSFAHDHDSFFPMQLAARQQARRTRPR